MIIFKKLKYQNFLSAGTNPIEIQFDNVFTTLIVGENGAGKCLHRSTVVDIQCDDLETKKKLEIFLKK